MFKKCPPIPKLNSILWNSNNSILFYEPGHIFIFPCTVISVLMRWLLNFSQLFCHGCCMAHL
eukprot:c48337_g1_i1 orf=2-184(-)